MAYILRFVQSYKPANRREFLALESQFQELEEHSPVLPCGRRSQPISGCTSTNTLIWECEFPSLAEIQQALLRMADDPTHSSLWEQQAPYIIEMRTEILELLDTSRGGH
jgi:hypothetical protein